MHHSNKETRKQPFLGVKLNPKTGNINDRKSRVTKECLMDSLMKFSHVTSPQ